MFRGATKTELRSKKVDYKYIFTIFTPTYNRGHTLHRVYESLQSQTFRDFEWLIVDDGSTDNTQKLVETWKQEASFPIRYIYQSNQGKHIAFNRGVNEARGALFLTSDSDDSFVPEALERFKYHWDSIPEEEQELFSAVTALCKDQFGKQIGTSFPQDVTDSNSLEIRYKYKVKGEKWGFQRTDVLKAYPFPETHKQTYIPEGIIWNKIARKYQTRFVNEHLRTYYREEGSIMRGGNPGKNALGGRLSQLTILNDHMDFFIYAPLTFFRLTVHYTRFSFHCKIDFFNQWNALHTSLGQFLWLIMLPVGTLVYLKDKHFKTRKF